jgi:hypothetical protein
MRRTFRPKPYEVDRAQWREFLRPFSSVKTLWVKKELVGGFSHSLRSGAHSVRRLIMRKGAPEPMAIL